MIAISTLRNNKDIVIKPADKGGNIVIMNKEDYIKEGLRQLSDNHYEILEEDPTQNYNNQIYQVLQQAVNLDIIDEKLKKTLYNKALRTPNFYMLPKIHKPNNPGRPIVNGIEASQKNFSICRPRNQTSCTKNTKLSERYYPSYRHTTRKEIGT